MNGLLFKIIIDWLEISIPNHSKRMSIDDIL